MGDVGTEHCLLSSHKVIKTSKAKAKKSGDVGGTARRTPKAQATKTFASYANTVDGLRYICELEHGCLHDVFRTASITAIYLLFPFSFDVVCLLKRCEPSLSRWAKSKS